MTVIVLAKDSTGNQPYRYGQIMAILTTTHAIKLVTRGNRVISLDKELIVNMMIEDCGK